MGKTYNNHFKPKNITIINTQRYYINVNIYIYMYTDNLYKNVFWFIYYDIYTVLYKKCTHFYL